MDFFTALKGRDDYCPHSPDEETEAQGTTRLLVEGRLVRAFTAPDLPVKATLSHSRGGAALLSTRRAHGSDLANQSSQAPWFRGRKKQQ